MPGEQIIGPPPNRNFVQDQRQEVIRFLTGLPPRHPFRSRVVFDEAKTQLAKTESSLETQRFILDRMLREERLLDGEEESLQARRKELREELDANGEVLEALRLAATSFDRDIAALERQKESVASRHGTVNRRRQQLSLVLSELDGEEDILTANVQAGEILRRFCAREDCQMFANSERSFGRSLLFLKDQIKDLRSTDTNLEQELGLIGEEIGSLDASIALKREERSRVVSSSPHANVSQRLGELTSELAHIELRLAKIAQYKAEKQKFERLLDRREAEAAEVAAVRPTVNRLVNATGDVRQMLSKSIEEWLTTLGAQNTSSAYFDDDFALYIDGEKFSATTHQSGSTRTRIVLAFHACLLEVSLARGGNHPGWLLFDAPRQHELSQKNFQSYIDRLRLIATKYPGRVQVVFSATDLDLQFQPGDQLWGPPFVQDGEPRFLGPEAGS